MLPQTGEIVMKYLPFIGIVIIIGIGLFLIIKRRNNKEKKD